MIRTYKIGFLAYQYGSLFIDIFFFKSDGVYQTRLLAEAHSAAAIGLLKEFKPSKARDALEHVATMVLSRNK